MDLPDVILHIDIELNKNRIPDGGYDGCYARLAQYYPPDNDLSLVLEKTLQARQGVHFRYMRKDPIVGIKELGQCVPVGRRVHNPFLEVFSKPTFYVMLVDEPSELILFGIHISDGKIIKKESEVSADDRYNVAFRDVQIPELDPQKTFEVIDRMLAAYLRLRP